MATDPDALTERTGRAALSTRPVARLTGLLTRTWRVLEYSSAYLALVGAAEVLVVTHLLSLPVGPAPLVLALVTYAVYANDRLVDVESDALSNPERTAFVRRYRRELYVSAAVAYGLAAALSALGGPLAFFLTLLPGVAWLAYALDWLAVPSVPAGRLKEVPIVSSVVVAAAWSLAVVLLPLAFAGAALSPVVGVVLGYFLLATFVNAEVANVPDVASDRENGVETMVTALGVGGTRLGLYAVSVATAALLVFAVTLGLLGVAPVAALGVGLGCLVAVVSLLGRADGDLLTLAAECSRLPVLVVLLALGLV